MKVRFGRNDVVHTEDINDLGSAIGILDENGPMGYSQSIEKLLLFTVLDQATKMSSAEDEATLTRLTGWNRQELIDEINNHISSIGI